MLKMLKGSVIASVKVIKDLDITNKDIPGKTDDERKIIWAQALLERAKQARLDDFKRMDEDLDWYVGEHWKKPMPTYRSKITNNRCFAVVESALPIITDGRPKAELIANEREDIEVVDQLKDAFDVSWENLDLDLLTVLTVKDALTISEGYWKIWFDHTLKDGLGELVVTQVSPYNMFPDPDSKDPLLKDAYYVCYHSKTNLSSLRARYPQKANLLNDAYFKRLHHKETDISDSDEEDTMRGETASEYGEDASGSTSWATVKHDLLDGSEKLYVTEIWVNDRTMVEYAPDYLVDLDGSMVVEHSPEEEEQWQIDGRSYEIIPAKSLPQLGYEDGTKYVRKYPYGRIITFCGDILLVDKPSPYEHGRCPYVRFFRYTVPTKKYFFSEIRQVIPLQKELNERKSQINDILRLTANPPIIVNMMSGIDINKMTNRPGGVWPTNMDVDRAAKWLQVPNIPSAFFVEIVQTQKEFDTVSGIHDITQGRKPTGITAGIAIESLQEAAQTRLRLAARFLETSHKHAAQLMVSIIWQYYRESRTIRKKGTDGWEYKTVNFHEKELKGGLPDIKIKPGSTMQANQAVKRSMALDLFRERGIDRQALLEAFEWENIDAVLERMERADQILAQQAQQEQMQNVG